MDHVVIVQVGQPTRDANPHALDLIRAQAAIGSDICCEGALLVIVHHEARVWLVEGHLDLDHVLMLERPASGSAPLYKPATGMMEHVHEEPKLVEKVFLHPASFCFACDLRRRGLVYVEDLDSDELASIVSTIDCGLT